MLLIAQAHDLSEDLLLANLGIYLALGLELVEALEVSAQ